MGGRDDRRHGDRIPINQEFAAAGSTWVSNLSLGGVFVHTEEPLPVGANLELRFSLLLDDPVVIAALGRVVRHSRDPQGMGVQFTSLEPLMRARIEAVLERQKPIDSGEPLRLPEPSSASEVDEDEPTTMHRVAFARPAPIHGLHVEPSADAREPEIDDDPTTLFPSLQLPKRQAVPAEDEPTMTFRPPTIKSTPAGKKD